MNHRELDAAGITEPALRAAYALCRQLNAQHGRTYFLATRLLPLERRSPVHALYGFARWADDIVDDLDRRQPADRTRPPAAAAGERPRARPAYRGRGGTRGQGRGGHRRRYGIEHGLFADFLVSMRSDLTVTDYPTYADLRAYMHGSAAVIGLQMLPVLGTVVPREEAAPHAAALGVAFQLTNFLRDVGEDLDRGRVYLPADLLAAHGVDRPPAGVEPPHRARTTRASGPRFAEAEAMTRDVYREAEPGIAMLDPRVRPCIRTAFTLYGGILDAIAAARLPVLHRRAVVPRRRRAATAAAGLVRILGARMRTAPARRRAGRRRRGGGTRAMNDPRGRGRLDPTAAGAARPRWATADTDLARGEARRDRRRPQTGLRPPSGNWFVVGASRDDRGAGRPYGRTVGGLEVVLWRSRTGDAARRPGGVPAPGRAPARQPRGVRDAGVPLARTGPGRRAVRRLGAVPGPRRRGPGVGPAGRGRRRGAAGAARGPGPARDRAARWTPCSRPWAVRARRTWSPTGSTRGTARGSTRTRSSDLTVAGTPPGDGDDAFAVDVSFRVAGRLVVPVRAEFTAPGAAHGRHAHHRRGGRHVRGGDPCHAADRRGRRGPRTAVVEAVVAASDRRGFALARAAAPVLRPLMRRTAGPLWRDDLAYAERRWALRSTGRFPG